MRISDWSSDVCSSDLLAVESALLAGADFEQADRFRRLAQAQHHPRTPPGTGGTEIGRASCRERACPYVSISVVAVSLKTKETITTINPHTLNISHHNHYFTSTSLIPSTNKPPN